jgi:hypothetical protein
MDKFSPAELRSIQWFIKFPEYRNWLSAKPSSFLYYLFDEGTGKSVLLSRILEFHGKNVPGKYNSIIVDLAEYSSEDVLSDAVYVYKSLIYQLVHLLPQKLETLLRFFIDKKLSPTKSFNDIALLKDGFIQSLPTASEKQPIFILIDSIDKAKEKLAVDFLRHMFLSPALKHKNIHVLAVGRPVSFIRGELEEFTTISEDTERKCNNLAVLLICC